MTGDTPTAPDAATDAAPDAPSAIVRHIGMIKAAAIIMGVLIIILTAVVIGTIASRLSRMSAPPDTVTLAIPEGARVVSAAADDDGMTVVIEAASGSEIWRLSKSGKRLQTITLVTE